jgi:hypothetical protein
MPIMKSQDAAEGVQALLNDGKQILRDADHCVNREKLNSKIGVSMDEVFDTPGA